MPVSIRLSRVGTKHKPFYRMVVVDSRKKRDGEFLENIGTIDGLRNEFITFKPERFDAWVSVGAQPSDSAKKLYRQFKNKNKKPAEAKSAPKKAAPKKEEAAKKSVASEAKQDKAE